MGQEGSPWTPLSNLYEWYHFVQGTLLIKNQDVNTRYFGISLPFWMIFNMAATKSKKSHIWPPRNLRKVILAFQDGRHFETHFLQIFIKIQTS